MNQTAILSGIDRPDLYHRLLEGKRIGLMTNQTGINRLFQNTIDILHKNYRLTALMGVEHGVRGDIQAGEHVDAFTDPKTGVPVYSLYGQTRRPGEALMRQMDVAVYDMQDVGVRFYTYLYSLSYLMEACAQYGVPLVVMDRVNPLGGLRIEGTLLEEGLNSFVGEFPMPSRYGLTVGEYALWVRRHLRLDIDLTIIPLKGWKRSMYLDDTTLPWVAPSPNCATLHAALCYIGTCIFEGTNLSEGRGTTLPFELIGAPYLDADKVAQAMQKQDIAGVHFRPCSFVPTFSKHRGTLCHGVQLHITHREQAEMFKAGLLLAQTIRDLYPEDFAFLSPAENALAPFDRLLGTTAFRLGAMDAQSIIDTHRPRIEAFEQACEGLRLYQ